VYRDVRSGQIDGCRLVPGDLFDGRRRRAHPLGKALGSGKQWA
jgi:hypothetical protein